MRWDDTALMAYVHGELDAAEAKQIERAMAADEALARRVRAFRNARRALILAYDSVAKQPIPEHLQELLDAIPDTVPNPDGPGMLRKIFKKPH